MASYGQPYNELGSAMVRVLALYLEAWGFDSGGVHIWHRRRHRDIAIESQTKSHFGKKLPFYRHLVYYMKIFDTIPSSLDEALASTETVVGE